MSPRIHDISPALHAGVAVWPGDVPFRRDISCAFASGANLDLSSVTTTVHVGAHADAPSHYAPGAVGIDQRPLDRYLGACQVVSVDTPTGQRVLPAHLSAPITAPRVLVRTRSFPDPDRFDTGFTSLSPELIDHLADRGVVLVGIDTPSVDPFESKALETHGALLRRDLAVLEGLVLDEVVDGTYLLVALPLRIVDADASPVRAVLVEGTLS